VVDRGTTSDSGDAERRETDARQSMLQSEGTARQAREDMADSDDAWDAARERWFHARMGEAEAQIKMWDAQMDAHQADGRKQYDSEVAALKARVDAAKSTYKEWKARQDAKTQRALAKASRQLDTAYASVKEKIESM
jgi:hypothetical protein